MKKVGIILPKDFGHFFSFKFTARREILSFRFSTILELKNIEETGAEIVAPYQGDQIGRFFKVHGDNFLQISPNILFGRKICLVFLKHHF